MAEGKDFWHEVRVSVTKDLIVKAVAYVLGLPLVLAVAAATVQSVRDWLLGDSHVLRLGVVLLAWLLLIVLACLVLVLFKATAATPKTTSTTPAATPEAPVRFDPDSFKRTPPRARALLALSHRVDSITDLGELFRLITQGQAFANWVDPHTTKAQLQHDMEDAERAGIVSIENVGTYSQRFRLTIPDGRDWVLREQAELLKQAAIGLTARDLRRPFR